jgi:hypothetical protein
MSQGSRRAGRPSARALLVAAAISFVFLVVMPLLAVPALVHLLPDGDALGPLSLPIVAHNIFLEALVGSALLTIISLMIVMAQQWRSFPWWLPFALALPVAAALIMPSALEHGGPIVAWLGCCALAAAAFCIHWRAFIWASTIWD